MTQLPVKAGIDGLPTGSIPTDPADFVDWFKNSFIPRWAANADIRNAIPGTGVHIAGTSDTPGFVGFMPRTPLSVMGNPTGVSEDVEDIVSTADGQFLQRAAGQLIWGPVIPTITVADSISGLGTAGSPLELVNDSAAPGNSKYYGTDGSGTKGFFPIGTPVALPGTIPSLAFWWESDNILGSAGETINRLQDRTPWSNSAGFGNSVFSATSVAINAAQLNSLNNITWPSPAAAGSVFSGQPGFFLNSGATYFIVASGSGVGNQAATGSTGTGAVLLYLSAGTPNILLVSSSTAVLATSSAAYAPGVFFQANATYDPSTGAFSFRQSRSAANSGVTILAPSIAVINEVAADGGAGAVLNGASLAAIIAYNRVLSPSEIVSVENYLFNKWNV